MASRQKGKPDSCVCRSNEDQAMLQSLLKPGWRGQRCRHSSFSGAEAHSMRPHAQSRAHPTHVLTDMHQGSLNPLPCPIHPYTRTHTALCTLCSPEEQSPRRESSLFGPVVPCKAGGDLLLLFLNHFVKIEDLRFAVWL